MEITSTELKGNGQSKSLMEALLAPKSNDWYFNTEDESLFSDDDTEGDQTDAMDKTNTGE